MGFLRHWMVSMHDDLRRTGHWLKASAWRWLCELSTSSSLLLVQSEGCICLYNMWLCPSCTVQSVFVTKWYDSVIACAILMVGSCRFESLFTCYIITLAAFGVLYRNSCQEDMEDLEMWDCTAVSPVVGSEARVLCYCATDDVFSSSLHSFMVLSHCLLYHRDQRFLSAVVLNLRRCRVVSSHYSLLSPSSKRCTR